MTPILIFFSWASAETAIPSTAIAANSPTSRRAALRTGIEILPGLLCIAFLVLVAAYHIGSADQMSSALLASARRRPPTKQASPARQGWDANCASMKAVTKRGIAAVRSRAPAHEMDGGQFRLTLQGEIGLDPRAQRFARHIDMQHPDHRNRRSGVDAVPVRRRSRYSPGASPVSSSSSRTTLPEMSTAPSLMSSRSGVPDGK